MEGGGAQADRRFLRRAAAAAGAPLLGRGCAPPPHRAPGPRGIVRPPPSSLRGRNRGRRRSCERVDRLPGDSGSASELGQALPFSLPVTRCARPSSLPLVFLKDLSEGGKLSRWQQREQGGEERAGLGFLAARETWCFLTCWKIYVPTCLPSPVLHWEGGVGHNARGRISLTNPESGRCRSARPFANIHRAACPPSSRLPFFLEVTRARLRSDPRLPSQPAGGEGNRELPALSPGSRPPLGGGGRGARRQQGRALEEEPKTPQTLAAASREALERARAKHKQTHAHPPGLRLGPPLGCASAGCCPL